MFKRFMQFLRDERGYVPATEWMLVATILTLGTIAAIWSVYPPDDRAGEGPFAALCSGLIQE